MVQGLGQFGRFFLQAAAYTVIPPFKFGRLVDRIHFIGFRSLTIVVLTGAFTGMVLGLQIFLTLSRFGSEAFLGPAVALSLIRELGPVLCAVFVTGLAGSALTAEIGIMRITEQIDALTGHGAEPDALPGGAGHRRGRHHLPAHGLDLRRRRHLRRLPGRGASSSGSRRAPTSARCRPSSTWSDISWPASGRRISFGIIVPWVCTYKGFNCGHGRRGRGARHHPGGGALLGADPGLGLLPGVGAAVIRDPGAPTSASAASRCCAGVDLEIATGEIMVVIGRSGGGKSVFLKHLLGLLRPDSGRGRWWTASTSPRLRGARARRVRERYGVVFQGGALFDSMSVCENVAFPLREKSRLAPRRDPRRASRRSSSRSGWPAWATRTRRRSRAACASGWPSRGPS